MTVLGSPTRLEEVLGMYTEVTPEAIRQAAAEHLEPRSRATIVVVPGEEAIDES